MRTFQNIKNSESISLNFGKISNGSYDPKLSWETPRPSSFDFTDIPWSYITIGSIGVIAIGLAVKVSQGTKKMDPLHPPSG